MFVQVASSRETQHNRSHHAFIHNLSDNLLLKIFYLCRPVVPCEDEVDNNRILGGRKWIDERWWYKTAHVCRRWRRLVLESASHLDLCLVCTYDTPVADMLAHSPLLPLIVDYGDEDREATAQDEEGILLALRRRRRVRCIRLWMHLSNLRKLVVAIGGEFPTLEYLHIKPVTNDDNGLILPETFRAPSLRRFTLRDVTYSPDMLHLLPPTPRDRSTESIVQCTRCSGSQLWRSLRMFIYILDDDSLLNIFSHCRPDLIGKDETDGPTILRGGDWARERWWYKVTHVCRRWRYLILGSVSHLGLCLHCTYGTPVANMLACSPPSPIPLIIDSLDEYLDITAEEAGMMLALQQRDRVRRIRLRMSSVSTLQRFIMALDGEFPILEYLYIAACPATLTRRLILPKAFRAPHLRHLILRNFAFQIGSPLHTPVTGPVTLSIMQIPPSVYFHPDILLQKLSLMPQLEKLQVGFRSPVPNHGVEIQLSETPMTTHVTFPNLRWFGFQGVSAYLDAILSRMTTPSLEKFYVWLLNQLTYTMPSLLQFSSTKETLRFTMAYVSFSHCLALVKMHSYEGDVIRQVNVHVKCIDSDWQVFSMVQILKALSPMFSAVEGVRVALRHPLWSEELGDDIVVDRTQWRELLRLFSPANTLQLEGDSVHQLVAELSRSLRVNHGESPMELLPDLKDLIYPRHVSSRQFKAFIDTRKRAGHPVTLGRR